MMADLPEKPLYDVGAEQQLLRTMLNEAKEARLDGCSEQIIGHIGAEHLFVPAHRLIYVTILDLIAQGEVIDADIVVSALDEAGTIGACGGEGLDGPAYIRKLRDGGIPTNVVTRFMDRVSRAYRNWKAAELAIEVQNQLAAGRDVEPLLEQLRHLEAPRAHSKFEAGTVCGRNILELPRTEWVIEGVIQKGGICVIYGPEKQGKSFLALDLHGHIANGMPWRGRAVQQMRPFYVLCEGAGGFPSRVESWGLAHPSADLDLMDYYPHSVDLFHSAEDAHALAAWISRRGYGLVFIDTLARAMAGGDENTQKDMSVFVSNLDMIRASGCTIVVVHHTPKSDKGSMRGSSVLPAAVDTALCVEQKDDGVIVGKMAFAKEGNADGSWRWQLTEIGDSVWLEPLTGETTGFEGETDGDMPDYTDATMLRQLFLLAGADGVTTSVWFAACKEMSVSRPTFYRRKKALEFPSEGQPLIYADKDKHYHLTSSGQVALRGVTG